MSSFTRVLFSAVAMIIALSVSAQTTSWTIAIDASGHDAVNSVKTDNNHNVIVTGRLTGSTNMNPLFVTDSLIISEGAFVAKYDSTGQLIWKFALEGNCVGKDIYIDNNNDIYIAGSIDGTVDFDPSSGVYSSSNSYGSFLAKYTSDSSFVFLKRYTGAELNSITGDKYNNLYVPLQYSNSYYNALYKYNELGNLLENKTFYSEFISDIAVDQACNVYLSGYFDTQVVFDPSVGTLVPTVDGIFDAYIIKFDSAFNYLWHNRVFSAEIETLDCIALDNNGNLFCAGFAQSQSIKVATSTDTTQINSFGWFTPVLKFDPNGNLMDYIALGSSIDMNSASDIAVDENNNVYIEGLYHNSFYPGPQSSGQIVQPIGGGDIYMAKYSNTFDYLWAFGLGSHSYEIARKLCIDSSSVYFCGVFKNTMDFDHSDSSSYFSTAVLEGGFFQKLSGTNYIDTVNPIAPYFNDDIVLDIDTFGSSTPMCLFADSANNALYFIANDGNNGYELWKTDGTTLGTSLIKDINSSGDGFLYDPDYEYATVYPAFTKVGNEIFFIAYTVDEGMELWKTDGTNSGTQMVVDLFPGPTSSMGFWSFMCELNSTLYFFAKTAANGIELWESDGTSSGTVIVKDIYPGSANGVDLWLTKCNNQLIFPANNGINGSELWISDGTTAGTTIITDMAPGTASFHPQSLVNCGDKVFFTMTDPLLSDNVGVTDGTAAGTHLVKDINLIGPTNPALLYPHGNNCFFFANDDVDNWELWYSNGIDTGTYKVKEINPTGSAFDYNFGIWCSQVSLDGYMYFSVDDGIHGEELWKSDGTQSGTMMVKDVFPGINGGPVFALATSDSAIFFAGLDQDGYQLWRSYGTDSTTLKLRELNPFGSGNPSDMTFLNGYVFFVAADPVWGYELWKYQLIDSIAIDTTSSSKIISGIKTGETLQLNAAISPMTATDRTISWSIISGESLASISSSGLLAVNTTLLPTDTIVVKATSDDGSKQFGLITVTLSLLNNQVEYDNLFSVFPNPADNNIFVQIASSQEFANCEIIDITGNVVFTTSLTSTINAINISSLTEGVYLIRVFNNEKEAFKKIIKN